MRSQQNRFSGPAPAIPERLRHAALGGSRPDFRATVLGTCRSIGLPVLGVPVLGGLPGWWTALPGKARAATEGRRPQIT